MSQVSGAEGTTEAGTSYRVFHSIPYAEPPIEQLRLRDPYPKAEPSFVLIEHTKYYPLLYNYALQAPWADVRDATTSGPACLQPDLAGGVLGSEDCLTLTIYTPKQLGRPPLPVMVWIPGGGFVVGGASKEDWDPEFFLDQV